MERTERFKLERVGRQVLSRRGRGNPGQNTAYPASKEGTAYRASRLLKLISAV